MHKSTGRSQVKLHTVASLVQTNKKQTRALVRKTVHIQPAKHKIDATLGDDVRNNKEVKDTKTPRRTVNGSSSFGGNRIADEVEILSKDNKPRYISHDSSNMTIQRSANVSTASSSPWRRQQTNKTERPFTGHKQPEASRQNLIQETGKQNDAEAHRHNRVAKSQTKSDTVINRLENDQVKQNIYASNIKTNKYNESCVDKEVPGKWGNEKTNSGVQKTITVNDTYTHSREKSVLRNADDADNIKTSSPETPSSSPENGSTFLSRKSVLSVGSVSSQTSLAERILENRGALCLTRNSGSVSSLQSSLSHPEPITSRRVSQSTVMTSLRAGSSKSDTAMDVKAIKKHLPDVVPREGENSSPVVKRRTKRKILQA